MLKRILISALIFTFLWIVLPTIFLLKTAVYVQEGDTYTAEISPNHSQEISLALAKNQNISQVQLFLKNKALQNKEGLNIFINSEHSAQEFNINGSNIGDPSWLKLKLNNFFIQNTNLNIRLTNPKTNNSSIFWYGQSPEKLSIQVFSQPNLKYRFSSTISNFKYWIKSTNHIYLIIYFCVLLFLCTI